MLERAAAAAMAVMAAMQQCRACGAAGRCREAAGPAVQLPFACGVVKGCADGTGWVGPCCCRGGIFPGALIVHVGCAQGVAAAGGLLYAASQWLNVFVGNDCATAEVGSLLH